MTKPSKIRLLYFDESADNMAAFLNLCSSRGIFDVIGTFRSFADSVSLLVRENFAMIRSMKPDCIVVRLTEVNDIFLSGLRSIRKNCPIRLIGILCGTLQANTDLKTIFDFSVSSPDLNCLQNDENLRLRLIYQFKTARLNLNSEKFGVAGKWAVLPPPPTEKAVKLSARYKMIAIGASAGGTGAVTEILSKLPENMPPILLVQHLPESFSDFFANNLDARIAPKVSVARGGEQLMDGNVYVAGYDRHLEIIRGSGGEFYTKCSLSDMVCGHRPSVNVLFRSVAKAAGAAAIGIILTGMGNDGAEGLLEMREAGAYTIGQDRETSTVYGMPMVAHSIGAVAKQLPLQAIAGAIMKAVSSEEKEGSDRGTEFNQ